MFVPIGLIIAFVLVVIFTKRSTRKCRWRENRRRDHDGQKYFKCMICGAETFTENGKDPEVCLAKTQPPLP